MKRLRAFGHFWYDFIVGDDWRLAIASAVALGLCGLFSHLNLTSWWIVPAVVVVALTLALIRMPIPALPWSGEDRMTPSAEDDE